MANDTSEEPSEPLRNLDNINFMTPPALRILPQDQSLAAARVYFIVTYRQIQARITGQHVPDLTKKEILGLLYETFDVHTTSTYFDRAIYENVGNKWFSRRIFRMPGSRGPPCAKYFNPLVLTGYPSHRLFIKEVADRLGISIPKTISEYDAMVEKTTHS